MALSDISVPGSIKTRFLIISDTHGADFPHDCKPTMYADVAIHCGDLTEESKLEEFESSLNLLREIQAPLKLVIAGNHDFTMDLPAFSKKVAEARPPLDPALVRKVYGENGEARRIFEKEAGIVFLDEGTHEFHLNNGAILKVFASPWTPSLGDWGFQYRHGQHEFPISSGVDLVITHGPPHGILDYTDSRQRAGCPELFTAIARAKPRMHCFGHIHEGWGAKLVTWRDQLTEIPSHFTDIDNNKSVLVEKLANFRPSKYDTTEIKTSKSKQLDLYRREGCRATSHCQGDENPLDYGQQTLFVNAAIEGAEDSAQQLPWLVDIELPTS